MSARLSPSRMIVIGILSTSVGIALAFLVERHGYRNTSHLVDWLALPLLALGSLAALVGSFAWARQTAIARLFVAGIAVLVLGALAVRIIPISVHNWTESIGFPVATTGLIAALFLVLAVVRWVLAHVVR
jgi:hypothetical protein